MSAMSNLVFLSTLVTIKVFPTMEFNCSVLQGQFEYVFMFQETLQSNTFVDLIV